MLNCHFQLLDNGEYMGRVFTRYTYVSCMRGLAALIQLLHVQKERKRERERRLT